MKKVPISFDEMLDKELLALAKKCIREYNDRSLDQYKVMEK